MIRWLPYVFVRIVFFFIAGILTAIYFPRLITPSYAGFTLVSLVLFYLGSALFLKARNLLAGRDEIKLGVGVIGLMAIFFAGYIHTILSTEKNDCAHLSTVADPVDYYKVTVTGVTKDKENSWTTEGEVSGVKVKNEWSVLHGKVLLYFSKKTFQRAFRYGDVLLVKGSYQPIEPPSNPGEFDFAKFSSFKNIYYQHFLNAASVQRIGHEAPWRILEYAYQCRLWAEAVLKKYIAGREEQGIILALVLGITDGLDDDLLSAYAATGAMHVLAVSGLHVGIIYGLVLLLLKPMNKYKWGKWTIAVLSIFLLWAYAFITGLSPSVLRAVVMFTFVAVGGATNYRTNQYNTLALSAFALLLYDPLLIMSVGFQLSYLAVLGILYIHPDLVRLYEAESKVVRWLWKATSVSIAAQVATFALGLLYFHQFPNYFVLSNLFVIPISFVVLVGGLILLMFSFLPVVAGFIGSCLALVIKLMDFFVFYFESLPFSITDNVYINTTQCWLLAALVVSLILLFKYRNFSLLFVAAAVTIIFSGLQWYHFAGDIQQQKISVYKIPGHSAFDLIGHGHAYFLCDSSLQCNHEKIKFHISPHRLICGIQKVDMNPPKRKLQGCDLIWWRGKSFLQIHHADFSLPQTISVDYLILSGNAVRKISDIERVDCKKIIIDSSNSFSLAEKLLTQFDNHAKVFSVLHQGAFIENL